MLSILVAYTKNNRVIGSQGRIPWNLPSERDRFKQICNNKYILMGRKSFEEIGHSLPYCTIIIISKTLQTPPEGCLLAHSFTEGVKLAGEMSCKADACKGEAQENLEEQEILVAGGGEIYRQALSLPETKKVYATEIDADFSGDVFFPELGENWNKAEESSKKEKGISYQYVTYTRT